MVEHTGYDFMQRFFASKVLSKSEEGWFKTVLKHNERETSVQDETASFPFVCSDKTLSFPSYVVNEAPRSSLSLIWKGS